MKIEKEGKQAAASTANLSHAEAVEAAQVARLRMKSHVKAGLPGGRPPTPKPNHNEALVTDGGRGRGLKVRTNMRAGGVKHNHNETLVRSLKIRTNVKAGGPSSKPPGPIRR